MSQWDKLLWKMRRLSSDLRFEEGAKALERSVYVMEGKKTRGSQWTFRKEGKPSITIAQKDPIKKVYVKKVKEAVEWEMENERS